MALRELNHFTLLTSDLDKTISFYTKIVGLTHGERLAGGFGEFLYFPNTNHAVIHVLDVTTACKVNSNKPNGFQLYATTTPKSQKSNNTNAIDHIAFAVDKTDFDKYCELLDSQHIQYRIGDELAPACYQLWFLDPNGIKVELSFTS